MYIYLPIAEMSVNIFLILAMGGGIGVLSGLIGVGGGFIMVPAMIYLLGMPTSVVIGTSLFQIIFVTANVTFLQALTVQTVDVLLAILLLAGAVVGAQFGSKYSVRMKGEQLRALLSIMVLGVCIKILVDLITKPTDLYSITPLLAG